jgi:hypothetical protein
MTDTSTKTLENCSRAELIRYIHILQSQKAAQAERTKNLENAISEQHTAWTKAFDKLESPHRHAQDTDKMLLWLLELHADIRPLLGVANKKYGMYELSHRDKANPDKKRVATVLCEILHYFDWDDE